MIELEQAVDFHSHIIPGADHGSKSVEVSKKQLEIAANAGVKYIVAKAQNDQYKRRNGGSRLIRSFLRRNKGQ